MWFRRRRISQPCREASRFANLGMHRHAKTTVCDTKAEIGESVDPVIHIERRSGRRILREVLGIVDTRPTRKAL